MPPRFEHCCWRPVRQNRQCEATEKQMRDHPLADRQSADVRPHGRHYARRLMAWYVRQAGT